MAGYVLVVDDDPDMRALLRLHLVSAGYEVAMAEDGIEAGYKVLARAPDLIVCDVKMPFMDGFEFVAALRADPAVPLMPVIFLTSIDEGEGRGKELGAAGYLKKPVRADRLLALVSEHLPLTG